MYGLFLLYVMTNMALVATGIVWVSIRKVEKEFKKNQEIMKENLNHFSERDILPVLKERNITHFLFEEGPMKIEVAYNGKTIYATLKSALFANNHSEEIYAFEYDLTEERLLYTERESYVYQKNKSYPEINPHLKRMTDRLIEMDWQQKALEEIAEDIPEEPVIKPLEKAKQTEEMEALKNKAQSLLEHVDLLEEAEKKDLHDLITEDIEKTIQFYQQIKKEDKAMYEPIILEKLKEIDGKLETITNRLEERKYKAFKEKLKIEYLERD